MVRNHRAIELSKMGLQAQEVGNCLGLESNSYQEIRLIVTTTLCVPKSVGSKDNSSINQLNNSQQDRNSEFENTFTRLNRDDTNFNVRIICALLLGNNINTVLREERIRLQLRFTWVSNSAQTYVLLLCVNVNSEK